MGGAVVTEMETSEVGTFPVRLEPAGQRDPLFSTLPPSFQAQMGHHDYVAELPEGAESLAVSDRCPNQALKFVGKPVYSTQFHSELGRREILERIRMYRESYLDGATMEEMKSRVGPSPAVKPLITRFLKMHT
jgi:GMP synthase (glutamine-hydrolysing)